jgi:two-component system, NarL family, response regulator
MNSRDFPFWSGEPGPADVSTSAKPIRALLVDRCGVVRNGVTVALNRCNDVEVVGHLKNETAAFTELSLKQTNVVLIGSARGQTEPDLIVAIKRTRHDVGVLVYGGGANEERVYSCVQAGANGYLGSISSGRTFAEAVRAVASGRNYFDPEAQACLSARRTRKELSCREVQILKLISEGQSNKEISSLLNISAETVKFHVSNVITKIGARDRTHAIVIAFQRGILDVPA